MTHRVAKPALAVAFVASTAAGPALLFASAAYADPGTIKVHAQGTPLEDNNQNEPKQGCAFYIANFKGTNGHNVRITFAPQAANGNGPAGSPTSATDDFLLNKNVNKQGTKADGRSRVFNADQNNPEIKPGQYKVTALDLTDQSTKTKVFRVLDCVAVPTPTPTPPPGSNQTPTPTPDGSSSGEGGSDDGDNPGDVGGVGNPNDDDGNPPVGGVNTGGGGLAAGGDSSGALPWAIAGLGGLLAGGAVLRRFRK